MVDNQLIARFKIKLFVSKYYQVIFKIKPIYTGSVDADKLSEDEISRLQN